MKTRSTTTLLSRTHRLGATLSAGLLAALTLGCETATVNGRVVEGRISTAVAAGPEDERLNEPGIEGAEVRMLTERGSQLASATTDASGEFRMSYPLAQTDRVLIVARKDGYLECRARLFAPRTPDAPLLVLLEPLGSSDADD
ncbi:MAG: hypothetical protein AAGG07_03465 [Planctomycetota bacterium]